MRFLQSVAVLLCLTLFCLATYSKAASNQSANIISSETEQILENPTFGTAEALRGKFTITGADTRVEKALIFIAERNDAFAMATPAEELELLFEKTDKIGQTHLRFQQKYNDLPVWGCQTIVHFDTDESIYLVGGQTIPTPGISTSAAQSSAAAESVALQSLKEISLPGNAQAKAELIIYPNDGDPKLTQLVTVTSPTNGAINWLVFVDAQTGQVLHKFNNIHFDGPDIGTGPDTRDSMRTFDIYDEGGVYRMENVTHSTSIVTYQDFYGGGPISTDPDNDKVWDDAVSQKAEVAGHYYINKTYEYFLNTHGRDSYDDAGSQIICNVHDPVYTNNAYWNGQGVNFADGDGVNWLPFSGSLDVVAHELAHGVTQYSAGLIYQFQSGALNESFSDVFGVMVDTNNWKVGEEIALFVNGFIRDMASPASKGHPGHMNDYINYTIDVDNGGVHRNSGIPNLAAYWAYLQLDRDRVEQIWYRALTTYLTPSSGFYFWAGMIMQSTIDLYGPGSPEVIAIEFALDVVGLNTAYTDQQVINLGAAFGDSQSQSVWAFNPGPGARTISAVSPTVPGVTLVPGPGYQAIVPEADSSEFTVTLDASGLGQCDVGLTLDSLRLDISGGLSASQIKLPMLVSVGFSSTSNLAMSVNPACMTVGFRNNTQVYDLINGSDALFDASLLIGLIDGTDTTTYRTFFGETGFASVDTISTDVPDENSFRIAVSDGRIQGNLTYSYDSSSPDSCGYIIAEYQLYNVCDTALTVYTGIVGDFDVNGGSSNLVDYDAGQNLIYTRDGSDTRAAGFAMLSHTPHNLRALHNPTQVWSGAFSDGAAYNEMAKTSNAPGPSSADFSQLMSFEQVSIGAGDTVEYRVAFVHSTSGSSGLDEILAKANQPATCCLGTRGNANNDPSDDANVADISYLVAWLFGIPSGPAPVCIEEANANNDAGEAANVADVSYLVAWLFGIPSGPAPGACP